MSRLSIVYISTVSTSFHVLPSSLCTSLSENFLRLRVYFSSSFSSYFFPSCFSLCLFSAFHFSEAFHIADVSAALAAGMFHREEVTIAEVKQHMKDSGIDTRL